MAAPRRVARQVETAHWSTFEDQLWPINVSLVVLGGFVAGAIIAAGRFDESSLLWNAWTHLATLGISLGGLLWLASVLDNRRLRRNLQLSALLSLLVHVFLALALYSQHLRAAVAYDEPDETYDFSPAEEQHWPVQLPTDQPSTEDLVLPVEAEAAPDAPVEIARTEPQPEQRTPAGEPTPLPGIEPGVQPSLMEMRVAEQTPSRRAESASLMSRQSALVPPLADEPISAPQSAASDDRPQQATPQIAQLERQPPSVADRRPTDAAALEAAHEQQAAELTRRESTAAPEAPSSLAQLERSLGEPLAAPRIEADLPQPLATADERPSLLPQASTALARAAAAVPQPALVPAPSPELAAGPTVAQVPAAQRATADPAGPASAAESVAARAPRATGESPVAQADAPAIPGESGGGAESPLTAAATSVVRDSPAPSAVAAGAAVPEAVASASGDAGGANVARADLPTAAPSLASAAPARNARAAASTPASPSAAAETVPAPGGARVGDSPPAAEPTQTALARGSAGPVGPQGAASFEAGDAAADVSAALPSASARRAEATQRGAIGDASVPAAPARISRSIAGAAVPQATLAADDAPRPDALGAARPSRLEANASAALARANAAAPAGRITAGAGPADIDLGPTQAVAPAGPGRPAAAGGPTLGPSLPGAALARATAPAAVSGAATSAPAPPAVSSVEPGGGRAGTGAPAVASAGAAVRRAAPSGGAVRSASVPEAAAGAGAVAAAVPTRAAAAASPLSSAAAAGGNALARATGPTAAADSRAEVLNLPAGPSPMPVAGGAAPTLSADTPRRSTAGIPGRATAGPVGVAAGSLPTDSSLAGSPGVGVSRTPTAAANSDAPQVADIATAGTLRKASVAGVPDATAAAVAGPAVDAPARAAAAVPTVGPSGGESNVLARSAGSLPVQIAAPAGPGGFGPAWTPDVGSLARRARDDTAVASAGAARFLGRTAGGPLAIDGRAREPAEAFANRRAGRGGEGNAAGRPSQRTERAVELGLAFLARHQAPDGRWSLHNYSAGRRGYEAPATLHSDTAATGLALLAFLGAGYDHYGDQYQEVVAEGLKSLLAHQQPSGDLFQREDEQSNKNMWLYSHGIATIALCEAYGMTGDPDLAAPAQRAIDFILASQHPELGGWRYDPQVSTDTSVTGWQLMALKSGELAGLRVAPEAYDLARHWLDGAQAADSAGALYVYDPFAAKIKGVRNGDPVGGEEGKKPNRVMTAVGLLMRLYLGWNRDTPAMRRGADYLALRPPAVGTRAAPANDAYYWYYTTQVMFHMRGDYWRTWHERLHALLVERQVQSGPLAGSWDPLGPVPDRWGPQAGRIYVTTLNLLSLEVTYRHLPIYESTAQ